ncbi:extracellular exonuclease ExeM [Shewanella alkalitolerans]|uniref:extracellular exonuclease ExeM n=1 Tax=Shewanella alkalitolerans TaxID=2864209 RepID=UPI001C658E88|nr:extracellular exonuclease ExeM [Shewanella alkalitolerans]QYJ97069.1 extracellular exonuclease ExeM [Shewanella alkalitolerans]
MDNVKKLSVLALSIAAALPVSAKADLLISEYVEGNSNNKAIELYNSGDAALDLTGYKLVRYKDGDTNALDMVALDGLTIDAKKLKVILHPSAEIALGSDVDSSTGNLYFNGGDAVALVKDGAVVDIIGAVPTPSGWGMNVTMQRNTDALVASNVFVESQWKVLPVDTFTGLGNLDGASAPTEPEAPAFTCTGAKITPIYSVQGAGKSSPLIADGEYASKEEVTIRGVVTARGDSLFKGFYLQEVEGDNSPYTSDGIFVFLGEAAGEEIQPGVEVCVQGLVKEYYGLTQVDIKADKKIEVGENLGAPAAQPFYVADGESLGDALERFEGMHVVLDAGSDMKVSRTFSYDYAARRNNMMLSHKAPLMKATQLYPAMSDEAIALEAQNRANQLFIESDYKAKDGEVPYFPTFNAENGYIRVGDQLTNLQGVVSYSYNEYRLVATNEIVAGDFIRGDDRSDAPAIATKGDIRVASFNVLNFFNNAVGGDDTPADNRGANTEEEMLLQRTKIVNAITAMNADIVGLMEIGNNGFGEKSAIQNLLDALNAELSDADAYSFVEINDADKYQGKFVGSDAITVGMLYRAAKVTPSGDAFLIATPEQHATAGVVTRGEGDKAELSPAFDKYQRHSLGQTFKIHDEQLTVVVNHLKSKGSGCVEDWANYEDNSDPADLQGKCNEFRVSAAKVIGDALQDVKGDLLVIGDMNAYGKEDPIRVLTDFDAANSDRDIMTASWTTLDGKVYEREGSKIEKGYGLINLNTKVHGPDTYSYSYNGELGNLDHALANTSLAERVLDIQDWHINAVESNLFEYGSKYTGELAKSENAFSASDHDPVIVALSYPAPKPEPKPEPEEKDDGGSLGYLGLMLLGLAGLRRRN